MTPISPPSNLERLAGNAVTEGALTAVAALAGGPIAALLPVLANSLAAERQKVRVEAALRGIDEVLRQHQQVLRTLTDAQYKLVNESILAILHTTAEEKMRYLQRVARNVLTMPEIESQEAVFLSRVIRDMSGKEAEFLCENFGYDRVQVVSADPEHTDLKVLIVRPATPTALIVTGLVSLGILESAESTWDESGLYRYSSIAAKLIALLRETS